MITIQKKLILASVLTISLVTLSGITQPQIFAEESKGYNMAEDVKAILTFTFRDGVEAHEFPVFSMSSDFVSDDGTSFEVKGVVGNAPHLHKALDEAFKFRLMKAGGNNFEYDYRFFDVVVDFTRNDESFLALDYYNCEIDDYQVETLNSHDYESYLSSKSGFAIVDTIEFQCGGVSSANGYGHVLDTQSRTGSMDAVYNYPSTSYKYAEDVRTFVTFQYDNGIERIEFPVFETTNGFGEGDTTPEFKVEGVLGSYPLLNDAIGKSRKVSGLDSTFNTDFNAKVEFIQGTLLDGETLLRTINYKGCIVDSSKITTQYDKEEGFTGKRGFAIVQQTDFTCKGMNPINPGYDQLYQGYSIMRATFMEHSQMNNGYNMGTGPHAIATFDFNSARETINFPLFEQSDILSKSNPTFELGGIVGDYPLLYKRVDDAVKFNQMATGASFGQELFDVGVTLMYDEIQVREFSYTNCRVVDYVVESQTNKEETYFKGNALSNTFEFECQGYHPSDLIYNAMFDTVKADTQSSMDLRDTQTWSDAFKLHQ
jgi:hypothetical protein